MPDCVDGSVAISLKKLQELLNRGLPLHKSHPITRLYKADDGARSRAAIIAPMPHHPCFKILIPDDLSAAGLDLLRATRRYSVTVAKKMPRAELLARIGDYDALIVRSETKVDAT